MSAEPCGFQAGGIIGRHIFPNIVRQVVIYFDFLTLFFGGRVIRIQFSLLVSSSLPLSGVDDRQTESTFAFGP